MSRSVRFRAVLQSVAALAVVSVVVEPSASAAAPATVVSIVRPVTAGGHAVHGSKVRSESGGTVDCSYPSASPAAVNRNILICSPSAEYAPACWRSATKHHVLCLRDARHKALVRLRVDGSIAHARATKHPTPLDIRLRNGAYCSLRIGGAGARLKGHPNYVATYYCSDDTAVWAPITTTNFGVNRSHKAWTVRVARSDGTGTLHTRRVAHAWFVGTRH